jgi:Uma2 family endonuclease
MATTTSQLFTAEDLIAMPETERYELWKGELRPMPPLNFRHGQLIGSICAPLGLYVEAHELGLVVAGDPGFLLARSPDIVLGPDVAFVRKGRLPGDVAPEGYPECAPDLVVEVVSPSDTARSVEAKAQDWLDYGCSMVLVVNARTLTAKVFRSGQPPRLLLGDDVFDGEDVVPGFRLPLPEIFK